MTEQIYRMLKNLPQAGDKMGKDAENPYYEFIGNRITELRIKKKVSEYKMSYDLGKSKGYIQTISSKKALPSMEAFLDICAYFDITPAEFFEEGKEENLYLKQLTDTFITLPPKDLNMLLSIAERLKEK